MSVSSIRQLSRECDLYIAEESNYCHPICDKVFSKAIEILKIAKKGDDCEYLADQLAYFKFTARQKQILDAALSKILPPEFYCTITFAEGKSMDVSSADLAQMGNYFANRFLTDTSLKKTFDLSDLKKEDFEIFVSFYNGNEIDLYRPEVWIVLHRLAHRFACKDLIEDLNVNPNFNCIEELIQFNLIHQLNKLDLSAWKLDDAFFYKTFSGKKELYHHIEALCIQFTSMNDVAFLAIAEALPNLRNLNMWGELKITDETVFKATETLTQLEDFACPLSMRDEWLIQIAKTNPHLSGINIYWADRITKAGVMQVLETLPQLEEFIVPEECIDEELRGMYPTCTIAALKPHQK